MCTLTPEPDGQPGRRQLLHDLQVDLVRLAAAAPALGVGQPEQPRLAQRPQHLAGELAPPLGLGDPRPQLGVRELPGQPQQRRRLGARQCPVDRHTGSPFPGGSVAAGPIVPQRAARAPAAPTAGQTAYSTASSRGVRLSRSTPPAVTTTMSSIRAPCRPGR